MTANSSSKEVTAALRHHEIIISLLFVIEALCKSHETGESLFDVA